MIWVVAALVFWGLAWALNVRLAGSGLVASRAGRMVIPALFGVTVLVVWEGLVRGLGVSPVILPAPSMIGARIVGSLPILWEDAVQRC